MKIKKTHNDSVLSRSELNLLDFFNYSTRDWVMSVCGNVIEKSQQWFLIQIILIFDSLFCEKIFVYELLLLSLKSASATY